jgi:DNA-binding transcriptional regulator YiaG
MQTLKEKRRISVAEIRELLDLRDWTYRELAEQLDVHLVTVQKWIAGDFVPMGPASRFMLRLLDEARAYVKTQPPRK